MSAPEFNPVAAADYLARKALVTLEVALRDLPTEDLAGALETVGNLLATARGLLTGEVTAADLEAKSWP